MWSALFARNEAGNPFRKALQGNPPGKHILFKCNFTKKLFFGLQTTFFDGFNVLLNFLAEKWYRTIMKSPQKTSFGPQTCNYGKKSWLSFGEGCRRYTAWTVFFCWVTILLYIKVAIFESFKLVFELPERSRVITVTSPQQMISRPEM